MSNLTLSPMDLLCVDQPLSKSPLKTNVGKEKQICNDCFLNCEDFDTFFLYQNHFDCSGSG